MKSYAISCFDVFFFQAEDGIRDIGVTGVQTCALPIFSAYWPASTAAMHVNADIARAFWLYQNVTGRDLDSLGGLAVLVERSEERRVGKERRSRWEPYH